MSGNALLELNSLGQSAWYDNISRELLQSGELKELIGSMGVCGLTSNPSIFDNAISKSSVYDARIAELKIGGLDADSIIEQLAVEDIAEAADLLMPVYDASKGTDGFVSIEVSPLLARDAEGTVKEGTRLFEKLSRPNVMIKVPGTPESLPAAKILLEKGINVNVTLLFSVQNYVDVAKMYISAMTARQERGEAVNTPKSVASFFISRVDSAIDNCLEDIAEKNKDSNPDKTEYALSLRGHYGVANSRIAYQRFKELFFGDSFKTLADAGCTVQRPLWASTSTKNPAYRDVLYIEELIGEHTVNTIPHATLFAFAEHGKAAPTIEKGAQEAEALTGKLEELGVDVAGALDELQVDGVKKFVDSFLSLRESVSKKM